MRNEYTYNVTFKQKSDIIASNINFIHKNQDIQNKYNKNSQNLNNDETQNNENFHKSLIKNSIDNFNKSYSFNSSSHKKILYNSNVHDIRSPEKCYEDKSKIYQNEEVMQTSSKKNPSIANIQNLETKPTKFNKILPQKIDYFNPTILKNINYEHNQENLLNSNIKNKEDFSKEFNNKNANNEIYKNDNIQNDKNIIEKNKSILDFVYKRSESFKNKKSNNNIINNRSSNNDQLYNNNNKCIINKSNFDSFNHNYDLGFPNNIKDNQYSYRLSLKQSNSKVNKFINLRDSLEIPSLTSDRYSLANKIMQNKANSNSQYFNNNNIVKNNIFNKSIIQNSNNIPFSNQNSKNNQPMNELDSLNKTKHNIINNKQITPEIRENVVNNVNNNFIDTSIKNKDTSNDIIKFINEDKINKNIKENSIIHIMDLNDKTNKSFKKKDSNIILSKKSSSNTNEKLSNNSLNSFTHKATLAKIYSKEIEKLNDFIDEQEQECDLETLIFKNLQGSLILENNNYEIAEAQNNYYKENENDKTITESSEKFASPNISNKNINDFFDVNSFKSDNFSYIDKVIENNQTMKEFEKNRNISFSEQGEIDKNNITGFYDPKEKVFTHKTSQNLSKNNNSTIYFNNLANSNSIIVNKSNSFNNINIKENREFNNTLDNRIFLSSNNVLNFKAESQNISKHNENNSIVNLRNNIDEKNKNNIINNKIIENIRNSNIYENNNFQIKNNLVNNYENKETNSDKEINNFTRDSNVKNEILVNLENSNKKKEMSDKLQTKKILNICFSNLNLTNDKIVSTDYKREYENCSESNYKLAINSNINLKNSYCKSVDISNQNEIHTLKNSQGSDNNLNLNNNFQLRENIKNFDMNHQTTKELAFFKGQDPNKFINQDDLFQNSVNVSCDLNSKKHSHLKSLSKRISNTKYVNKKLVNLSFSRNSNNSRLSVSHKGNIERFTLSSNSYQSVNKSNLILCNNI